LQKFSGLLFLGPPCIFTRWQDNACTTPLNKLTASTHNTVTVHLLFTVVIVHTLSLKILADLTACSMIGHWHETVARLSVRPSVCDAVHCR